jgi:hypothetical protein
MRGRRSLIFSAGDYVSFFRQGVFQVIVLIEQPVSCLSDEAFNLGNLAIHHFRPSSDERGVAGFSADYLCESLTGLDVEKAAAEINHTKGACQMPFVKGISFPLSMHFVCCTASRWSNYCCFPALFNRKVQEILRNAPP